MTERAGIGDEESEKCACIHRRFAQRQRRAKGAVIVNGESACGHDVFIRAVFALRDFHDSRLIGPAIRDRTPDGVPMGEWGAVNQVRVAGCNQHNREYGGHIKLWETSGRRNVFFK
jgi:hypothetical protein